jgi:hypothetical protein
MPNPMNNIRKEQWDDCPLCGRSFPMSQLMRQRGRLVCRDDYDDLQVERRDVEIARILRQSPDEGSDRRVKEHMIHPDPELEVK